MSDGHHPSEANGWNTWSKYVIKELRRLSDKIEDMDDDINDHRVELLKSLEKLNGDIRLLKFQASLWGSAAGALLAGIVTLLGGK